MHWNNGSFQASLNRLWTKLWGLVEEVALCMVVHMVVHMVVCGLSQDFVNKQAHVWFGQQIFQRNLNPSEILRHDWLEISCEFSRIWTWVVEIEVEHADHSAITNHGPKRCSSKNWLFFFFRASPSSSYLLPTPRRGRSTPIWSKKWNLKFWGHVKGSRWRVRASTTFTTLTRATSGSSSLRNSFGPNVVAGPSQMTVAIQN